MKEQKSVESIETGNVWMIGAGLFVFGLAVGYLIGWYWQGEAVKRATIDTENFQNINTTSSSSLPNLSVVYKTVNFPAFVSVDDQKAGSLVFVKHTEVSKPTWIAVREILNGVVGNILGAEMVTSASDDVPVTLLRSTITGQKYAIYLYQDDGDGEFDFKTDLLVTQNELPVAAVFAAE